MEFCHSCKSAHKATTAVYTNFTEIHTVIVIMRTFQSEEEKTTLEKKKVIEIQRFHVNIQTQKRTDFQDSTVMYLNSRELSMTN